jgi:uncharacterized protein YehS (DUF1456 family)
MTNNDILRRLRYTFDISDKTMIEIFALGNKQVKRPEIINWMRKEDDENYINLVDKSLAHFLNGFIVFRRGKKDDPEPIAESKLNNNIIFRKLKIALNLRDDDIIELLKLADFRFSKHELSALFRKPTQNQYRKCKDQVLRNFLYGMQIGFRE